MYYGCEKEIVDKRDYKMKIAGAINLPKEFKLKMPSVKDQGIVNSCVAHSLSTLLEQVYLDEDVKFSVGFIYGYRPEGYYQNMGMYPREAIKTLHKIGDVKKSDFDYNKEMKEIKRLVDANFEKLAPLAADFKIDGYSRIYTDQEIKECIYNGMPVPASIPVRKDLALNDDYTIKYRSGIVEGYHMITIYGWNEKGLIFQNSWGKDWGDNGSAIIPYGYGIDSAWAISTETNNIETYQTTPQKLYTNIFNILELFRLKLTKCFKRK